MKNVFTSIFGLLVINGLMTACDFTKKEKAPVKKSNTSKATTKDASAKTSTAKKEAAAASKVEAAAAIAEVADIQLLTIKEQQLRKNGGGIIIRIDEVDAGNLEDNKNFIIYAYYATDEAAASRALEDIEGEGNAQKKGSLNKKLFSIAPLVQKNQTLRVGFESIDLQKNIKEFLGSASGYLALTAKISRDPETFSYSKIGAFIFKMDELTDGTCRENEITRVSETAGRKEYAFELKDFGGSEDKIGSLAFVRGSIVVISSSAQTP